MFKRDFSLSRKSTLAVLLAISMLLSAVVIVPREVTAAETSRWVQMGSINTNGNPDYSSLFFHKGTPYIFFREDDSVITLLRYDAEDARWEGFPTLDSPVSGTAPQVVLTGSGRCYLACVEDNTLKIYEHAKRYVGPTLYYRWQLLKSESVDTSTMHSISMTSYNETIYITYAKDNDWNVLSYDGSNWNSLGFIGEAYQYSSGIYGGSLLEVDQSDGTLYAAYYDNEKSGRATVKKYDGSNWVTVGNAGFSESLISHASFVVDNGTPYFAYESDIRIYVKKYDGSAWIDVDTDVDIYALRPSLALYNGTPYVAISSGSIFTFNGTQWVLVEGTQKEYSLSAPETSLVIDNGILYLAYINDTTHSLVVELLNTEPTNILLNDGSVTENLPIGTVVGTLSAEDSTVVEPYEYTLVEGDGDDDNVSFTIEGAQLKTAEVFDYEAKKSYSIRIAVEDGGGLTYEKAFTISIEDEVGDANDIEVDLETVPQGYYNQAYSYTPTVLKGDAPYAWSASGLPDGLNINSDTGEISGTPTVVGTYEVTLLVTDKRNITVSNEIEIVITYDDLSISLTALPNATLGETYSCTLSAEGGDYDFTWYASGLPEGMELDYSSGKITGKPLETGEFDVKVAVGDGRNMQAAVSYTLTVSAQTKTGKYTVTPNTDAGYTVGSKNGYKTMTVKSGITGFRYFNVSVSPSISHAGKETVIFVQMRGNTQIAFSYVKADFDLVTDAGAGFNVKPGDVIKVYIVDDLTNSVGSNPVLLQ